MKRVKDLVKSSTKAVCGISEREVTVQRKNLSSAIKRLQKRGFYVVGTSHGKTPTKKIWFIRRGGL